MTQNGWNSENPAQVARGGTGLNTITDHSIMLGSATSAVTPVVLTDGQLLIGVTGADPSAATLSNGTNISITSAAGAITINATGTAAFAWTVTGVGGALVVNTGKICTTGAALSFSLPATSAVGDVVGLSLNGSTSWTITQAANQQIQFGSVATTLGAVGTLASTGIGDTVTLVCVTTDLTWIVISSIGNMTVV